MEECMFLFPEVEWDRWAGTKEASSVFGWILRNDGLRDFIVIRFIRGNVENFTTSSAKHSAGIADKLGFSHSDCKLVSKDFPPIRCIK